MKDLKEYVITIPDFPEEGILFRDITGILNNADGFKLAIDNIAEILKDIEFDDCILKYTNFTTTKINNVY